MSKRIQEDAGEERVTAKSKRCSERDPNVLASTASECPGKTRSESQIPLSSWTEQQPRTGRLVMDGSSPDYSEWNIVDNTCLLKSGNLMNWWTIKRREPMRTHTAHGPIRYWTRWDEFLRRSRIRIVVRIQIILAQGEWSSAKEANTILKRCNKRQRQTLCDMENVCVFYIASICIHGKELLRKFTFRQKIQKISQWSKCSTYLKSW